MGVELDWLEREERYRRRVVRMMVIGIVLVGGFILGIGVMRGRALKERRAAEAQRSITQREQNAEAVKAQFSADSAATANRLAEFVRVHAATRMADLPILQVPLPPGVGAEALAQRVWTEYARVADPAVSSAVEADWYRLYYVDLMNSGPLRGRAVLLPAMRQERTSFVILKPSFSDITRAQIEVGMREMPAEIPGDSLATSVMDSESADPTPPASTTPPAQAPPAQAPPAQVPPAEPKPTPAPPVAEPKAQESQAPAIEPLVEPAPVPAAPTPPEPKPAASDSTKPPE